jgi:cytochrome o ubiquinol oxidase subunit 3
MSATTGRLRPHEADEILGFWIYLMTDCVLFAALFAAYAVWHDRTDGGPGARALFDLRPVAVETGLLLGSSLAVGLAMLALERRHRAGTLRWLFAAFLLGAGFVGFEIADFAGLLARGAGPDRSAFLSAFWVLVGTHGLHVAIGLVWLAVLMLQLRFFHDGITPDAQSRAVRFSLFWHFLDLVWICVFSFVYLAGMLP